MKKVIRIDSEGKYIEDVLIPDDAQLTPDLIAIPCPNGFYLPRWDGIKWVEGLTQAEIDAIKNTPQEPTSEDRLKACEDAISALMGV